MKSGEIAQAVLEKKSYKNYSILYMYIAQWQGQITLKEKKLLIITKIFYYFNHTL